jgi:hypothetical protein
MFFSCLWGARLGEIMSYLINYSTGGGDTKVIPYTSVSTSPYIVLSSDQYMSVDSSIIPIIIQLPNASVAGRIYTVKDRLGNCSVNNITITTVGGIVLIEGAASFVMNTNYESVDIIFNGVGYEVY